MLRRDQSTASGDDSRDVTRRGLLWTVGATAGATLTLAGNAAASSFQAGDCARVAYEGRVYESCDLENWIRTAQPGELGTVEGKCTDAEGRVWVLFRPNGLYGIGYVRADILEHC